MAQLRAPSFTPLPSPNSPPPTTRLGGCHPRAVSEGDEKLTNERSVVGWRSASKKLGVEGGERRRRPRAGGEGEGGRSRKGLEAPRRREFWGADSRSRPISTHCNLSFGPPRFEHHTV